MDRDSALVPLVFEPLHEQVYRAIRAALMVGRFPPGEKLLFRSVAQALCVSPSPVRVALGRLVAERALGVLPNGTVVVPVLTRRRFDEIVEMRILLEGMATERAATRVSKPELATLADICRQLNEATAGEEAEPYLRLTRDVKFTIYKAADHPTLVGLIESLWLQFGPFMHHYTRNIRQQAELDCHEDALKALKRHAPAAARKAIEQDIRSGAKYIVDIAAFAADDVPGPASATDDGLISLRSRLQLPKTS